MSNAGQNIGDAPGLSGPPDPPPNILDDRQAVEELIAEKLKIENSATVVEMLADFCINDFYSAVLLDHAVALRRQLEPIIDEANRPNLDGPDHEYLDGQGDE